MKPEAKQLKLCIGILLAALTALCYWPLASNQFINLDDPVYIVRNPNVNSGLSWAGVLWAFQTSCAANWHPLTWISHMADCSLFGLNPGGHHLMSLLFHVANTLLLFGLLERMTGAFWRSAVVAAFFAWHPVHVESVAWASERKDVLSTFFFLLTLLAYVRYVQESKVQSPGDACQVAGREQRTGATSHATRWRALALVLFALGLMCKPMVVTLPFVLLLLDFWPLQRLFQPGPPVKGGAGHGPEEGGRLFLLREKIPFFALSVASSVVTFVAQHHGGAVSGLSQVSLPLRIGNALLAYVRYLRMTCWPTNLIPVYPLPDNLPGLAVTGAALFLGAGSLLVVLLARRRPYLVTGWCWYLGTLVPTIGLVQVGPQALADRYLYIPSIGLFLLVVWGLADLLFALRPNAHINAPAQDGGPMLVPPLNRLSGSQPSSSFNLPLILAAPALASCLALTWVQAGRWHDAVRLFRHARQAGGPNYIICDYLGAALAETGCTDDAITSLTESVRLAPRYAEGQYNLGTALLGKGRLDEALDHLKDAVQLSPTDANAHHNLGNAYLRRNQLREATTELAHAAALKPDDAPVRLTLGTVLLDQGRLEEAAVVLSDALRLAPDNAEAHRNLGVALVRQGKAKEARGQFAEAVRLDPKDPGMRFNLGLAFLDQGRPEEAAVQFTAALQQNPNDAKTHFRLAVALSRQHKTEAAVLHFREALRLHPDFPEAQSELALTLASNANLGKR